MTNGRKNRMHPHALFGESIPTQPVRPVVRPGASGKLTRNPAALPPIGTGDRLTSTLTGPRVFITQRPIPNARGWVPDFTPAAAFGSLHFVFEAYARPADDMVRSQDAAAFMLRNFRPELDFLLWPHTGCPLAFAACNVALTRRVPYFTFLNWSRNRDANGQRDGSGVYIPVRVAIR